VAKRHSLDGVFLASNTQELLQQYGVTSPELVVFKNGSPLRYPEKDLELTAMDNWVLALYFIIITFLTLSSGSFDQVSGRG
jgi:sulfur carrier protein ThiS